MTIETDCSECRYLECHRDGFPGRLISFIGINTYQKSLSTIEKCLVRQGKNDEIALIHALGMAMYLPPDIDINPELTLEQDDKRRRTFRPKR